MGAGRVIEAVADAGPIIHLAEIDCLFLLHLFERLCVPQAVWLETINRATETRLLELGHISRYTPTQAEVTRFVQDNGLQNLHSGECESLYLCRQINIPYILTDDLAVREAAKRLKLTPIGSLGIVVKSYRNNLISLNQAERYLLDLHDVSTLFVTRAIVELAVEELHRQVKE